MLIDWFTVGAQTLNFLILVWLMKRFLYKPILDAIDAREKRIASELADADSKRDAAQKERDEFRQKNKEFDQQRTALMSQVTDEVTSERKRLLDEARAAANELLAKRQEALRHEQQSLAGEITRRTREEVFAIARKTLTDLAGASLEERMCNVFTRRVREMGSEAKDTFATALESSPRQVFVRSAFELPTEQQAAIQCSLNETFATGIHLRFETAPTVISGIELNANGLKIGWSIAEYLMTLEKNVGELLQEQTQHQVRTENEHVFEKQ
ncbi:MAG: F0F1 ATP synthase subunit B [Pirellulales bacterium]